MTTSMPPSRRMIQHEVWEEGTSRGIRIAGWDVETRKKAILNASEIEEATTRLDIPLPEITFGNNLVSLKRRGKQRAADERIDNASSTSSNNDDHDLPGIVFHGLDALAEVDTTGQDTIKVSYADKWAQSRNLENNAASIAGVAGNGSGSNGSSSLEDTGNTTVIETVKDYDWTYTTVYAGTCSGHLPFKPAPPDHPGIPLSKLARQDEPILFFDEVTLFEDELHDNGVANLTIRIRIMPSGLFLLSRFFLRVDNVLFRIYDVRLYHDFETGEVIREAKGKEAPYNDVRTRLPRERADDLTPLTDHNWVANILGMLENQPSSTSVKNLLSRSTSSAHASESLRLPAATAATRSARAETGSTLAPWTAASLPRRQVVADVATPIRLPTLPLPNRIATVQSISSSHTDPADAATRNDDETVPIRLHGAKRPWIGLGTKLEVLQLP